VLLQDYWLLEKLATFNRERIPERIVHAKPERLARTGPGRLNGVTGGTLR